MYKIIIAKYEEGKPSGNPQPSGPPIQEDISKIHHVAGRLSPKNRKGDKPMKCDLMMTNHNPIQ